MNQIEAHPLLLQDDLVAFCKEKNIHITAYSPLGNNQFNRPKLTDYAEGELSVSYHERVKTDVRLGVRSVKTIADKLNATTAQVLIAWGVKRGYSVIPKSVQEERIISNFKEVELSDEDFAKLTEIGKKDYARYVPSRHPRPPACTSLAQPEISRFRLPIHSFNIPCAYSVPKWDINIFDEPEEASMGVKAIQA